MREKEYVIKDAQGIHARPAGQLVKLAQEYMAKYSITALPVVSAKGTQREYWVL